MGCLLVAGGDWVFPGREQQEGAACLSWCPQVWFVGGQEQCLSLAELCPRCGDIGHGTGWSLGLGEQEAPVTRPALKASPYSDAICSWLGGEALWHWGDFVQPLLCHVRCCPALHAGPAQAPCSWALADSAALGQCAEPCRATPAAPELLGRMAACSGCAHPPAPAPALLPSSLERFKGAQGSTEGIWAMGTLQEMPLQCHCDPGGSPSRHTPWTFFHLFRTSVSIALRRSWGFSIPLSQLQTGKKNHLGRPSHYTGASCTQCSLTRVQAELSAFSEYLKHPGDPAHSHRDRNPKEICRNEEGESPFNWCMSFPVPTSLQLSLANPALEVSSQPLGAVPLANTTPLLFGSQKQ